MRRRLPAVLLAAILLGSFALHADRAWHPTTSYQSADERSYGKLAVNLADNGHYGDRTMRDPLHWPPGAPALFAVGHKVFGEAQSARTYDIPAAYWLQAVVSTLTALAAFGLARAVAGTTAGLVAAALVGYYPPLILATGEQVSEPLGALLLTTAFFVLALALRTRGRSLLAAAGAVFGLAVLTRTDLLPLPFVVAAVLAGALWWQRRELRRALAVAALLLAGYLAALAPWSLYASLDAGELVPVTRGGASALFVGTYLPGKGTTVGMKRSLGAEAKRLNPKLRGTPDFDLEARSVLAVVAARHPELPFEDAVALEARKNLVRYGLKDPLDFAAMMLDKGVQRMWSRYARGGARHTSPWIRGWHIALVLAAFAGLGVAVARRRSLLLGAILAALLTATAVHMIVVAQARYNLPLLPSLLAGGTAGWFLWARARRAQPAEAEPQLTRSQLRTRSLESLNTRS